MRNRTVPLYLTLGAMAFSALTACSGGAADPPGTGEESDSLDGAIADEASVEPSVGESQTSSAPPTTVDIPTVNIRTVDLGNMTWLYSFGGFDLPVEVKLVGGTATIDGDGIPIIYTLGDVSYGDIDGDGDDDAAAMLSRGQDNGYEALWYVWLAEDSQARQLKYPIARTGRCGTLVEPPVIAEGGIELTEYLRIPGLDDALPCSEPGTGLKKRTISVYSDGSDEWPVQTAPVAAWGGLCAGAKYLDTGPGMVDLWAAPSKSAAVAAVAGPDGAVFEQKGSPLVEREGWGLVGFRVLGVESDLGGADMACAWAPK